LHFAIYAAFCLAMLVIAFIDLDHQLILDRITIPSIGVFYAASFAWPERHWYEGLLGAIVGYAVPWTLGAIYFRIRHREAMGIGDSMLLAVVGALLGWTGVVVTLFLGSILGTLILLPAMLLSRGDEAADEAADDADEVASKPTGDPAAGVSATPAVTTTAAAPSGASASGSASADPVAHALAHTASEAAPAASGTADPAAGPSVGAPAPSEGAEDEKPSLLFTEVPFGTFLALAAVLWLFAEPWLHIHFHLPGG
jgi:Flp pilus assembly protein protease CpaA